MSCCPVVRTVRVGGSCSDWFPLVLESLRSYGWCRLAADPEALFVSGEFPGHSVSVSLSSAGSDAEVVVSVTSNVDMVEKIVDGGVAS